MPHERAVSHRVVLVPIAWDLSALLIIVGGVCFARLIFLFDRWLEGHREDDEKEE